MPLPVADKGMALFPQPQLLQDYANAGLQKLNAARWIRFNPRWPAAHGRSNPSVSTTSSQALYRLRRLFMLCFKSRLALTPLLILSKANPLRWALIWFFLAWASFHNVYPPARFGQGDVTLCLS